MLPNAALATVDPAKVRDYLLSPAHPIGRFKATVFFALGYTREDWPRLRDDLLAHATSGEAVLREQVRAEVRRQCYSHQTARSHGPVHHRLVG